MKDKVHERLGVIRPNWPREEDYLSLVGKIDLEIQPENDLFIFQGYINGRPKAGVMAVTGSHVTKFR